MTSVIPTRLTQNTLDTGITANIAFFAAVMSPGQSSLHEIDSANTSRRP